MQVVFISKYMQLVCDDDGIVNLYLSNIIRLRFIKPDNIEPKPEPDLDLEPEEKTETQIFSLFSHPAPDSAASPPPKPAAAFTSTVVDFIISQKHPPSF